MIEGKLGINELLYMTEPMDIWNIYTRGSSARVFQGILKNNGGKYKTVAVKIMRPDKASYALPMFQEEVTILNILEDVPGVMRMHAAGFLDAHEKICLPDDSTQDNVRDLEGDITLFYPDEHEDFLQELQKRIAKEQENLKIDNWVSSWVPYIIVQTRPVVDNLLFLCDPAYSGGKHLDWEKGLEIITQICDVLEIAHKRNIVYRDHKLLHYYYSDTSSQVYIIDWNVAKYHPNGLSKDEIKHDLVEFGARAMHYIITGRPVEGALGLGPTRPVDVEAAPDYYEANWIYDDERLPPSVKELIENVLSGVYEAASDFKNGILELLNTET
jgi:serine/threonine protein kinase